MMTKQIGLSVLGLGSVLAVGLSVSLMIGATAGAFPPGGPPAWRILSGRLAIFPNRQPYLSQTSQYRVNQDALSVWRAYARYYGAVPAAGMGQEGACVCLSSTRDARLFRYTVEVRLCPVADGTRVYFQQTLAFTP